MPSTKKKTTKKAKKSTGPNPTCVAACVREFVACIRKGGDRRECRNKLTRCVEDCI